MRSLTKTGGFSPVFLIVQKGQKNSVSQLHAWRVCARAKILLDFVRFIC